MYGLPKLSIEEILDDLKSKNLIPSSLKEINTQVSNANKAAYSVVFKRSSVTLSDLKKVQFLCRTKVSWKRYLAKESNNPTFCWKCLMYGHGGDNCFRQIACMICASTDHVKADCPFDQEDTAVKCFNCIRNKKPSNHRANDKSCPSRAEYLLIRQNIQRKNQNRFSTSLQFQNNIPSSVPQNISTSPVQPTYASVTANGQLYSISELFQIFQSSLNKLRQCTTKDQQIEVVAALLQHAI